MKQYLFDALEEPEEPEYECERERKPHWRQPSRPEWVA